MMLRSLLISCLLSTCFPAGGRAQNTSQSGSDPITTVTVQSKITVVPIPYTSPTDDYLPASPTPTCDVGSVTCPVCDGEDVDVDGGFTYKVHCDAGLSSNKTVLQPAYITPNQCLFVCETALDCVGTTLAANGSCVLTIGPDYRLSSSTGEIAFVQSEYIPSNSTSASNSSDSDPLASKFFSSATIPVVYPTSYPNATDTPTLHLPKPNYTNFTLPNATHSVNSSIPTNNTCSISNPTCPACNNQTLTDRHNVTYTVLCGYKLDATLDYALGEPLPATYCMSRCDERNVTCLGASWSTEECVLALGPYVKIEDPDKMAFIRAAFPPAPYPILSTGSLPQPPYSTGLSYLNMSRYDGSSFAPPTLIATTPVVQPTITVTDPPLSLPTSLEQSPVYPTTTAFVTEETRTPTPTPSQDAPQPYGGSKGPWGGSPPWAQGGYGGGYGIDEGSRHHPPQGSWWQGGRPHWSHWGWGKPSSGSHRQKV
jgi:hypothetical protein